jgi:serine/threonine-protein kinase
MKREVALKTLLDEGLSDPALQYFFREWNILATMVHPNVVNIYDIGEFEQDGTKKPFFVMPLLPGVTLDRLIKEGSPKLSVDGVLHIVDQACRGLQAAHEQGLVHRDVKPSNVFVMEDNSVKIIDFGIARGASAQSKTSVKGTIFYIAPEQLELKPPTALSDLFSLAVTTYEALTRRRPFQGINEPEVMEAIRNSNPPPVSEVNPEVSFAISQVVHKAMAKDPRHRFPDMRTFADALQKASRNEPLEFFDRGRIKARLDRAEKSFQQGEYGFASELLSELEGEGHLDQAISLLRGQLEQAMRQVRARQLIDNARRFFEASEYTLALRKIQEALDLDANDGHALALKTQVEKERREKKIEEWIGLARQHLANQAFGQAREALDNVVRIKPNDTVALSLLAEVAHREREVARVRGEKSKLYQSAVQAWEKGEVTTALSKLEVLVSMDRDLPEPDLGRSGTYQNFYNQVRSEHSSLKNDYDEARRLLSEESFEAALEMCGRYLSKYPAHALFQALKFDIEDRQRQALSSVIAATDRRVEEEPDLDRRVAILEEVLKLHPGEQHFERAIRLVRDKRDLVNSIVAKARYFEERGQFVEAVDQWQILQSIHDRQPGLAFDIQRLIKRRDQQGRDNAKARWVEQTEKYLDAGDYERAGKTVQSAIVEFPGEPELLELGKLVGKFAERSRNAMELLTKAREFDEAGAREESLAALREAYQLDPRNTVIHTVLVNSLLEKARAIVDSDRETADAVLREILGLEPRQAAALSMATGIADRKREDFIAICLAQARRMQGEENLEGALAEVARGLNSYPNELRLQKLQAALGRAQAQLQTEVHTPVQTEVHTVAGTQALPEAVLDPVSPPEIPEPQPVPEQPKPSVPPTRGWLSRLERIPAKILYGALALAMAILAAVVVITAIRERRPQTAAAPVPLAPQKYKVRLHASAAGARIAVNGQPCGDSACELELEPGSYQAEASLSGYQSAKTTFSVTAGQGAPEEVNFAMLPAGTQVSISTDLPDGKVLVDGAPSAQPQGGALELSDLSEGPHTVSVEGGTSRATFSVEIKHGSLPVLSGPVQTQNLRGFFLAKSGSQAHLYASALGFAASVDGKPAGTLGADGLDLKDLAPGHHEVSLDGPSGQHGKIAFDTDGGSGFVASLTADANLGILWVTSDQDDATVYLDGQKWKRSIVRGRALMYLTPKHYTVRLEKEGFVPSAEQQADLKKGEQSRLEFKLAPAKAALRVHHAAQGSELFVDGTRAGAAGADGEFSDAAIEPGKHAVAIRHEGYEPIQMEQSFLAGKTVDLNVTPKPLMGNLRISVEPASVEAKIKLRREGETQDRDVSEKSLTLPEGRYIVTGSAPGFPDSSATVQVLAARPAIVNVIMKPSEGQSAKASGNQAFALADWEKAGGWTHGSGGALTRQGGDFVLAPRTFTHGTLLFTVFCEKGKRIEWVMNFRDEKNYSLFQLDGKNFHHIEVMGGNRSEVAKSAAPFDRKNHVTIEVAITPGTVTHKMLHGQTWDMIDVWQRPTSSKPGSFGFNIPKHDVIDLSEFRYRPE